MLEMALCEYCANVMGESKLERLAAGQVGRDPGYFMLVYVDVRMSMSFPPTRAHSSMMPRTRVQCNAEKFTVDLQI